MQERINAVLLTVAMGALAGLVSAMRVDYMAFAAYVRLYANWSELPATDRRDAPKPDFDMAVAARRWWNGALMGALAGLATATGFTIPGAPSLPVAS